ncbi:MAG: xanthine dehydrogenase small subunit [Pseudomonadota bacterium]
MCLRMMIGQEIVEIRDIDTNRTLLDYIRYDKRLTGTKEGCAEGDCGACTVIIGAWDGSKIRFRLANACITLLGACHNKLVITIENLAEDGALHPMQRAFIDHHAQQCGFCTPGIIMALAWHHETNKQNAKDSDDIDDAMAGNLCRCTGYGSIRRAARQANRHQNGRIDALGRIAMPVLQGWYKQTKPLHVAQDKGEFYTPRTEQELARYLHENPDARMIAGGTDLMLDITKKLQHFPKLVHLQEIPSLQKINDDDAMITLGSAVSYEDILPIITKYVPAARSILLRLGGPQVRAQGTIGGNIANGSPIGDGPPLLIALGARVQLESLGGMREIALEDFFLAYGKQDLCKGEYVARILVPKPQPHQHFWGHKISKRFDQDISAILIAALISEDISEDSVKITHARLAFGGMAEIPKRAYHVEAALHNERCSAQSFAHAAEALHHDFHPISDMRASSDYRQKVAGNLITRLGMCLYPQAHQTAMLNTITPAQLLGQ